MRPPYLRVAPVTRYASIGSTARGTVMPLNSQFFASVRSSTLYGGSLTQEAVNGMNAICAAFDGFTGHEHCVDDLAFVFANCYRETGKNFDLAIREIGRGAGKAYGKADGPYNLVYYGRGPTQTTWLANYQKAKLRLNIDFVQFPDKLLDPVVGSVAMLDGMYAGLYTGKSLRTYITPGKVTSREQFKQCRRIINGLDHADEIADNAVLFQRALLTGYDKPLSTPPALVAVQSQTPPATQPRGLWYDVKRMLGRSS